MENIRFSDFNNQTQQSLKQNDGTPRRKLACSYCQTRRMKCEHSLTNATACDNCVQRRLECDIRDKYEKRSKRQNGARRPTKRDSKASEGKTVLDFKPDPEEECVSMGQPHPYPVFPDTKLKLCPSNNSDLHQGVTPVYFPSVVYGPGPSTYHPQETYGVGPLNIECGRYFAAYSGEVPLYHG